MDVEILNRIESAKSWDLYFLTREVFYGKLGHYKKILKARFAKLVPPAGDWNEAKKIVNSMLPPVNYDKWIGLPKVLGYCCDWIDGSSPYFLLTNHKFNVVYQRFLSAPKVFLKTTAKKAERDEEYEQTKAIFK